jgi:hypothetical protein
VGGPSRIRPTAADERLALIAAVCFTPRMEIRQNENQVPFTTKYGSTIRSLLDRAVAPVRHQSLAEATLPVGGATQRHYHRLREEF